MFQVVKNAMQISVGEKFIDLATHKVVSCEGNYPLQGYVRFVNVEDETDDILLTYRECHERLRRMDLSNLEIRALLCQSMLSFIELMLGVETIKGGENNGK